jgi:hypothetical protein
MAREDAQFSIVYDGEAVAEGSIDAKELAPALMALAEVIEQAQPLIPELEAPISLRVRSDFERGSFEIHLELAKLYDQIPPALLRPGRKRFRKPVPDSGHRRRGRSRRALPAHQEGQGPQDAIRHDRAKRARQDHV